MNAVMYEGKKSVAEQIVYGAFDIIESKAKAEPLPLFKQALENVAPAVEVVPAASAARPIRSRLKSAPSVARRLRSAGSSTRPAPAMTRRWSSASPPSCSMPPTTAAMP
jgi:Ribosomal protein S7